PQVRHPQQVLRFRTRKALALLLYLAVEGGMHSRQKIAALFWPESDDAQARTSLRRIVLDLRQALGETAGASHLLVRRDALGVDFTSDVELDCVLLERAFTLVRQAGAFEEAAIAANDHSFYELARATAVYRGAFLDGFALDDAPDFDDWIRQQRAIWQQRISLVFDRLSQWQLERSELAIALETTNRWLVHDSLSEVAHRRLIQAYIAAGNHMAALRAYETYRMMLSESMHIAPSVETEELVARIRAEALAPPVPRHSSPPPSPTTSFAQPGRASKDIDRPLVGRAKEYITMVEIYSAIQQGQAQLLILRGEAGIGKTRLARSFLDWAKVQGADILAGRAFETESGLPYQPLVEAFRTRIERENAPDDLLNDVWLVELSRLLPELRERYPDLPAPGGDDTTAVIRLFEALARLGQALARRTPLVLFIDDLQWADAASLDVLHYAARRWAESNTRILLLLCVRTEALATMRPLTAWLSRLEHDLPVTSVPLNSLSLQDVVQLVQILASAGAAIGEDATASLERFGRWLFAETHGQPFYVAETLNALLEQGMLSLHSHADGRRTVDFITATRNDSGPGLRLHSLLPAGVRAVIQSRLAQLSQAAFAMLAAGSVLEHDFTFAHLCQATGIGEPDGVAALDELLVSHLLHKTSDMEAFRDGTYSFTHDKIRDVMYTEAGEARRRMLHHRALEIFQRADASPAVLAHHASAAGLRELAFHFGVAAGDEAMRLFAVQDAIAHFERVRQLVGEYSGSSDRNDVSRSISPSEVQQLYLKLGRACELAAEWERARSVYQTLLLLAQESKTSTMACAALNRLAMLTAQIHFDLEEAVALAEQALQIADDANDSRVLAETEWTIAQLGIYRFDAIAVLSHGERALELAQAHGGQELNARCLNVTAYGQMMVGQWEEAERKAREARALYAALEHHSMEVDCLCVMANASIYGGQPQAAIEAARMAHTINLEIENVVGQLYSGFHLAIGLLEIGAYSEALALAQRGLAIARTQGVPAFLSVYLTLLGKVYRSMLNLEAAHAAHFEALTFNETLESRSFTGMIVAELCAVCVLESKWIEAYHYAIRELNARETLFHLYTGLTFWFETEALVRAGDVAQAAQDVSNLKERLGNSRRYHIPHLRAKAVLAEHHGEIDGAIAYLQEAAQLAQDIGLPGEEWSIQAALGEMYWQRGKEKMASIAFAQASEILLSLAQKLEDEQQRTTFLTMASARWVLERAHLSP
ncbi:MAG TPA: AAA family ATPase, partial [Ktedonobacteraceae bacterium]